MPAVKGERWHQLAERLGELGVLVDGRWSEATLAAKLADMERTEMVDEPALPEPILEGDQAWETDEEREVVRAGLGRKLMAMGIVPGSDWDIARMEAEIEAKQRETAEAVVRGLGVEPDPSWTLEQLRDATMAAREPVDAPEGIDMVHARLREGEGELVTCISRRPVSLGDGQKLGFKQRALVPADIAAALKGKDLCL